MTQSRRGVVLNVHAYGAIARLEDGRLASIPASDLERNRAAYERAMSTHRTLNFAVEAESARHPVVSLAPQIRDDDLEEQIAGYLKSTQEWEDADAPPAHERHFLRKKRRAALFESRHTGDR